MKTTIRFVAALAVLALLQLFSTEEAGAQTSNPCPAPYAFFLQGPASISFDPSLSVNSVLWTGKVNSGSSTGNCNSGVYGIEFAGTSTYLNGGLYESGIPGIAYRLKFANNMCYNGSWPGTCTPRLWNAGIAAHDLQVELVKTGPISGGGSLTGTFGQWTAFIDSSQRWTYATYSWSAPIVVKPVTPTCAVTTPSINVPVFLGDIPASRFSGIGSTSKSEPFNIVLQCSGGDVGRTTNVHLTLTDQTNSGNTSNVLSLTEASTATGVGIQVRSGTTIISYGPDSAVPGNPGQWKAGTTGNGTFTVPLTANYVQTGSVVTGGSANGRATFTMSYQ